MVQSHIDSLNQAYQAVQQETSWLRDYCVNAINQIKSSKHNDFLYLGPGFGCQYALEDRQIKGMTMGSTFSLDPEPYPEDVVAKLDREDVIDPAYNLEKIVWIITPPTKGYS